MNVTRGSGTPGCGRVLGVNSGRGSGLLVFVMYQVNTHGSTAVPALLLPASRSAALNRQLEPTGAPRSAPWPAAAALSRGGTNVFSGVGADLHLVRLRQPD
jgi:hypothetical protein